MNGPLTKDSEIRMMVREPIDIAMARKYVRRLAVSAGFSTVSREALATAVSEIVCNIVCHAGNGEVSIHILNVHGQVGIEVIGSDEGPGIPDLEQAMADGFSTAASLGLGLSSAKRLVDEFQISSTLNKGTMVVLRKWAA